MYSPLMYLIGYTVYEAYVYCQQRSKESQDSTRVNESEIYLVRLDDSNEFSNSYTGLTDTY